MLIHSWISKIQINSTNDNIWSRAILRRLMSHPLTTTQRKSAFCCTSGCLEEWKRCSRNTWHVFAKKSRLLVVAHNFLNLRLKNLFYVKVSINSKYLCNVQSSCATDCFMKNRKSLQEASSRNTLSHINYVKTFFRAFDNIGK